jgi:excisionase family DNA binding protein
MAHKPMDVITVREAAAVLKVNPITIRRHIRSGRLAALRVGKQIRIERSAVESLARPVRPVSARSDDRPYVFQRPGLDELARRKALVARILANREHLRIAPLTTADLVHLAREEAEPEV